jgi:hypothetical protein
MRREEKRKEEKKRKEKKKRGRKEAHGANKISTGASYPLIQVPGISPGTNVPPHLYRFNTRYKRGL